MDDWLGEDTADKLSAEYREVRLNRAKAYHNVFAEGDGNRILTEWIQRFATGNVPDANASMREVGMRDGKQQLIREILDQLAIATNGE